MASRASGKVGLLILHGMGSQQEGYSRPFRAALRRLLGSVADRVVSYEIYWAAELEQRERQLWLQMRRAQMPEDEPIELRWRRVRRFIVHSFADALAYNLPPPPDDHRDPREPGNIYQRIHGRVESRVEELYGELGARTPVVVVAHSLGAHIVSNYIWDTEPLPDHLPGCDGSCTDEQRSGSEGEPPWSPIPTLAGLITFGANIPLFSLAFDNASPVVLPGKDLAPDSLREYAAWLNLLDLDDVLGWPIRALYEPATQAFARAAAERLQTPRARDDRLGLESKNLARTPGPAEVAPRPLHCRRQRTVERIRDLPIDAGPFPHNLTPLSHAEYWTDPQLVRPTADYLRGLLDRLDGGA